MTDTAAEAIVLIMCDVNTVLQLVPILGSETLQLDGTHETPSHRTPLKIILDNEPSESLITLLELISQEDTLVESQVTDMS